MVLGFGRLFFFYLKTLSPGGNCLNDLCCSFFGGDFRKSCQKLSSSSRYHYRRKIYKVFINKKKVGSFIVDNRLNKCL